MLRFKKKTGELDLLKNKSGRGYYLCPSCAISRESKRMLKISEQQIKKQLLNQIIGLIQIGWRSRIIEIGFYETQKKLKKGEKGFLILAEDIAERTKRNILMVRNIEYFQIFTKEQIGSFLGKKNIGIIFVPETEFGLKLKGLIAQYLELKRR